MDRRIVYDDSEITAVWQSGSSNYLLITFGDMISLASGDRFYADGPVTKHGLNGLGFMAKRPNWYPKENMVSAARSTAHLASRFESRVLYGGSMGGYAAIKYSVLLGASEVIALCPQWSIDPAETVGNRNGYENHFRPALTGMGIRPEDIAGRAFVLFDPAHPVDAFHFRRIAELDGNVVPVHVHAADHRVTSILAGTSALVGMVRACRAADAAGLRAVVNEKRRRNPARKRILLRRAVRKHPTLVHSVLRKPELDAEIGWEVSDELNLALVKSFVRRGKPSLAAEALQRLSAHTCRDRLRLVTDMLADLRRMAVLSERGLVMTSHRTILAYDALDGTLRHAAPAAFGTAGAGLHPVFLAALDGAETVALPVDGEPVVCCIGPRGQVGLKRPDARSAGDAVLVAGGNGGALTLKLGDGYACAVPDGGIRYDRQKAKAWEMFATIRGHDMRRLGIGGGLERSAS